MISPRVCSNGAMVVVVWRMEVRSYATQPFFSVQNCFAPFFQSNELLGPVNYTWQHTRPTEQNPVENLGFEPVR